MNIHSINNVEAVQQGRVFHIQRFSTHDGPGIRTTVFLKGCPLNCVWCHNPESKMAKTELGYTEELCIHCGGCQAVCPKCHIIINGRHHLNRQFCLGCGKCVAVCPAALEIIGRTMTAEQIICEVMQDVIFYGDTGGLTLSGGEPYSQPEFTRELLCIAKENGITTAVETSGYVEYKYLSGTLNLVDYFLFDCKETDSARHLEYVGVKPSLILDNLHRLDRDGARIILRCPIVPPFNNRIEHLQGIAQLANSLFNVERIEIEPGHSIGEIKYRKMGYNLPCQSVSPVDEKTVIEWIMNMRKLTDKPVSLA